MAQLAIKIPRLHYCGRCYPSCLSRFLFGLYANNVEAARWRRSDGEQRQRLGSVIGGGALCLLMERYAPLDSEAQVDSNEWVGVVFESECVPQNFGQTTDGRIVAVDYAFW